MLTRTMRLTLFGAGSVAVLWTIVFIAGGFSVFFSKPALFALAMAFLVYSPAGYFAGGNIRAGEKEDRGNRWVLVCFGLILLLDLYIPPYTDRIDFWTIDSDTVRWLGVTLFVVGGALRLWPVYVLRDRFSGLVAIQKGHTLETSGIYGVIRHPSYLGMSVNTIGWCLAFRSVAGLLLSALLVPPLLARIHAEEKLLRNQFGDEYAAYCAHTSRMIPGLY
jgi:protein-S-isoprenylcysteine O-methyltransferase Ste14